MNAKAESVSVEILFLNSSSKQAVSRLLVGTSSQEKEHADVRALGWNNGQMAFPVGEGHGHAASQ